MTSCHSASYPSRGEPARRESQTVTHTQTGLKTGLNIYCTPTLDFVQSTIYIMDIIQTRSLRPIGNADVCHCFGFGSKESDGMTDVGIRDGECTLLDYDVCTTHMYA